MAEESTKRISKKRSARSEISPPLKKAKRASTAKSAAYKEPSSDEDDEPVKAVVKKTVTKSRTPVKAEATESSQSAVQLEQTVTTKVKVKVKAEKKKTQTSPETNGTAKRKRKTKEEKEAEAMPLAARTLGSGACLFVPARLR